MYLSFKTTRKLAKIYKTVFSYWTTGNIGLWCLRGEMNEMRPMISQLSVVRHILDCTTGTEIPSRPYLPC